MSKLISILVLLSAGFVFLPAQNIDEMEIKSYGNRTIEFINYEGPRTGTVNTLEEILNIGRTIGSRIDIMKNDEASYGAKYTIIHVFEQGNDELLDADILVLHKGSRVDHVNNLRFIIAGYLETTYGYSFKDALILAEFITYYNAVYYKNITYFGTRYKAAVMGHISDENAGMATHYSEWPGKTRIIIPLRDPTTRDELSVIDTGSLTEDEVIDLIREEEDMGIDSRKDMTDLRERTIDEDQQELDVKKEELDQKEEQVDQELSRLEEKEKEQGLTEEEEKKKEELITEKEEIQEEQKVLEEEQKDLDQQTDDVITQRDEIAEDENTIFENESTEQIQTAVEKPVEVIPALFHRIDTPGDGIPFGTMIKLDLNNKGKTLIISPITSIRGDTVIIGTTAITAIAGSEKSGTVKLIQLDTEKLEMVKESDTLVFSGAALTEKGGKFFTIVDDKGKFYLGAFDTSLQLKTKSEITVKPDTALIFQDNWVLVQTSEDKIIVLDAGSLKIKP
jgi:hypothetical protein